MIVSRRDPRLLARVLGETGLLYTAGSDPGEDRPAHVRSASAVVPFNGRLAVLQDDAFFVALVMPTGGVDVISLPPAPGGRRLLDKARKMDLEAGFRVTEEGKDLLVALGSGSSERRRHVALVRPGSEVSLHSAPGLYDRLRDVLGIDPNVEGAVLLDQGCLRLFHRGSGGRPSATCDLSWAELRSHLSGGPAPKVDAPVWYDLGSLRGVPLGFTDAARTASGILYSAAAENTPDAIQDGPVAGSALGFMADDRTARWTELIDAAGAPCRQKVEGVCPHPTRPDRVFLVIDADNPEVPSLLAEAELRLI